MEALKEQYVKEVVPAMMKKFNYSSVMQVPKLEKIVINIGLGETKDNPKALDNAMNDLSIITGQRPIVTKAKKSIAAFKLREGAKIGCKVTLRSGKMYDFAYKLFNVALPRVRDFRGVSANSFASSSVLAVVTNIISIPLNWSTLSYSISGNINCSFIPKE